MKVLATVDNLLRGALTRRDVLRQGRLELPTGTLTVACLLLGAVYGAFMGMFALLRTDDLSADQLAASAVKVPLLFLLTMVVAYPSLYVFSALGRSRLSFRGMLALMLASTTVNLAVLASLGPVTGFFTLSTESYPFMVVLNCVFFAIAGLIGLKFLWSAAVIVFSAEPPTPATDDPVTPSLPAGSDVPGSRRTESEADPRTQTPQFQATGVQAGAVDAARSAAGSIPGSRGLQHRPPPSSAAQFVFSVWMVIFGIVGAQMAWILRPFIGDPSMPFSWFRQRESNFFVEFLGKLAQLLGN